MSRGPARCRVKMHNHHLFFFLINRSVHKADGGNVLSKMRSFSFKVLFTSWPPAVDHIY